MSAMLLRWAGKTGSQSPMTSQSAEGDSAAAPTPSSSHSLGSPSPSPQPATPTDSSTLWEPPNDAPARSQPIRIKATGDEFSRHRKRPHRIPGFELSDCGGDGLLPKLDLGDADDDDLDMTSGPLESFGRARQDSFVSAGPKPIGLNPNRDHGRSQRESLANSFIAGLSLGGGGRSLGGMSLGGVSLGSFIREDLLMTGTSPHTSAPGQESTSIQSSSYIPKMEAEYLRNFSCCGQKLDTMHDLLRHYETEHTAEGTAANIPQRTPWGGRPSLSNGPLGNGRQNSNGFQSPGGFGFGQQNRTSGNGAGSGFGNLQMGRLGGMDQSSQRHSQLSNFQATDELEAIGEMEMDDPLGNMEMDDVPPQNTLQQTRQLFGQNRPHLQLNLHGTAMSPQALRTSQPSTPGAATYGFQNNPTVSSVNTPTLNIQSPQHMSGLMDTDMMNSPMLDRFQNSNPGIFIDDPAKHLYNPTGAVDRQRALQQQMSLHSLDQSQLGDITANPERLAMLHQALSANPGGFTFPREEDKPFKCPVIGCEKAYKNQNGLKYHKQHGHQNQQLHENSDGSFSIVNPETSVPYPGEMGMEKEKPHKCEYCNKRYKNLNGLKYHKSHSPACEIAAAAQALAMGMSSNAPLSLNMANGLADIGEM